MSGAVPLAVATIFGLPIASTFIGPVTAGLLVLLIVYVVRTLAATAKQTRTDRAADAAAREHVLIALKESDDAMSTRMDKQDEQLVEINKELKTNGGASLRDDVKTVIRKQAETADVLKSTVERLNDHMLDAAGDHALLAAHLQGGAK